MSLQDNDNLYILEEEENKDIEDSPRNFAAYSEEEIKEEKEDVESIEKDVSPFGLLLKIMFNPVEGWKTLRRVKISVASLQSGCFYPLLALLAVSEFADFLYSVNVNLSEVITKAVIAFVAYFFGYFCVQMVVSWLLPKEMALQFEEKFGKEYTIVSLSTLALFSIITNLLPMLWPILIFLPIWTLYLMFKGVRFFKFPMQKEMRFFVIAGASVLGMPFLIDWVLTNVLPY